MLTFDTFGIELYVTENNPKTLNSLIHRLKYFYKDNPHVDSYNMAYGLMPSQTASSFDANSSVLTDNRQVRHPYQRPRYICHIAFGDDGSKQAHPDMLVEKKSDSPDEHKSVGDSSPLKPILSDFFSLHPHLHPDTFLGDSAFDTIETYGVHKVEYHFFKALIP